MAAEWAARWFGGPTTSKVSNVVIAITPTRVLPNNPRRVFWQVINRASTNISLGFDNSVTVIGGIPLAPSAGFASMAVQEDGEAVSYEIVGISDTAGASINVFEVLRV